MVSDAKNKKNDDYAMRVGVLFSDGVRSMTMPEGLKVQITQKGHALSHVVFYCAAPLGDSGGECIHNPYSDSVVNCLKSAGATKKKENVFPVSDLRKNIAASDLDASKLKIIGLWLFADSDNVESDSDAWVSELKFSP